MKNWMLLMACAALLMACGGGQNTDETEEEEEEIGTDDVPDEVVIKEDTMRAFPSGDICQMMCSQGERCPGMVQEFDDELDCMETCIDRFVDSSVECRSASMALMECVSDRPCDELTAQEAPEACLLEATDMVDACAFVDDTELHEDLIEDSGEGSDEPTSGPTE